MSVTIKGVEGQIVCACCGACVLQPRLVASLEALAGEWMRLKGRTLRVNSGYRCVKHNQAVGGAKASRHMIGQAVDCSMRPSDIDEFVALAKKNGFNGIGIGETFVHVDVRAVPCEPWHYTKPRVAK